VGVIESRNIPEKGGEDDKKKGAYVPYDFIGEKRRGTVFPGG